MAFREILERELTRRRARNPRYSMRAFAAALAIDHSSLSQILRGKRRLTMRAIRRIGAALRLPPHEIEMHCAEENDAALLEIVGTDRFRADSRWLATILGIPVDAVNVALQRLVRLRALCMSAPDQWEVLRGKSSGSMADRRP